MNCCVRPLAMLALDGKTWIDTSVAVVTTKAALGEVTPFRLALTLVVPAATDDATPFEPATLLIVLTVAFEDDQVAVAVRFWVEPSV